ncbi:hypothetical protein, partial [Thermolongibacillus altinsuensis]|uniref:hypothetical protein n=1 Tax=Thermolongibacillus altinsuensis TaxID=575256 RepID=UPI0025533EA3
LPHHRGIGPEAPGWRSGQGASVVAGGCATGADSGRAVCRSWADLAARRLALRPSTAAGCRIGATGAGASPGTAALGVRGIAGPAPEPEAPAGGGA